MIWCFIELNTNIIIMDVKPCINMVIVILAGWG